MYKAGEYVQVRYTDRVDRSIGIQRNQVFKVVESYNTFTVVQSVDGQHFDLNTRQLRPSTKELFV